MTQDIPARHRQAHANLVATGKMLIINAIVCIAIAGVVYAAAPFFHYDNLGGRLRDLSAYCGSHDCVVAPGIVSAVYFWHAVYSILFILTAYLLTFKLGIAKGFRKQVYLCLIGGIAIVIIAASIQRFGFERRGIFSNYVYMSTFYLMHPAFVMLIVCAVAQLSFKTSRLVDEFPELFDEFPK